MTTDRTFLIGLVTAIKYKCKTGLLLQFRIFAADVILAYSYSLQVHSNCSAEPDSASPGQLVGWVPSEPGAAPDVERVRGFGEQPVAGRRS